MELTRHLGKVDLPFCADYELLKGLGKWLDGQGFADAKAWHASKKTVKSRRDVKGAFGPSSCQTCIIQAAMSIDLDDEWNDQLLEDDDVPLAGTSKSASKKLPLHRAPKMQATVAADVDENIQAKGHIFRGLPAGPSLFSWDAWKSLIWDLFTLAGFFTYPHHDASGLATYAFIREGCKIWGILRPRVPPGVSRNGLGDVMRTILRPAPSLAYQDVSDVFNIFLLPGDVLIQPPNAMHQVYTPVNAIGSGVHFLTYETLHLTEIARWFDHWYHYISTNADHSSVHRTLCRMAMALIYAYKDRSKCPKMPFPSNTDIVSTAFYRRPTLALAAMVCEPESYEPKRVNSDRPPGYCRFDALRMEIETDTLLAQQIMKFILKSHGLDLQAAISELHDMGEDWKDGSGAELDLSCLAKFSFK